MLDFKLKHIVYLLMYALPNTALSFGIVYIINNVLAGNEGFLKSYMGISFFALIVYTYLLNIIFQKRLNKFSFERLYENEMKIFDRILYAPLQKLEKYGAKRFFTTVEDLRIFSLLPSIITHTVNSLLMLLLCLIYMMTLSMVSSVIVVVLITLVAGCYFQVMKSMSKKVSALRQYNEQYYELVDDVIKGFKELKLSYFRRQNLMNKFLAPNRDQARDVDYKVSYVFLSINLISQYGLYVVIAVILFVLPFLGLLSREDVIAYVVLILFISGPINNLINMQHMYTRFMVASSRIKKFMNDFNVEPYDVDAITKPNGSNTFESLSLNDIAFNYTDENKEQTFVLGPINIDIRQGETIFIVGGNGSGKSTFINILTGLYSPTEGEFVLNGISRSKSNSEFKNLIAAVFTDNHIFSRNYDTFEIENNDEYNKLLTAMELEDIVRDDKDQSVRRKFSKGQSKRMSLIFALLEDKPIMVLDEWAADQDPHFRRKFYEELLPKFKQAGKTIIAVTHDDAYFQHADRIIKFDYGTIIKDVRVERNEISVQNIW